MSGKPCPDDRAGLRLSVNIEGERQELEVCGEVQVHGVNKFTVMASESYTGFVSDLQKEIKADLYEALLKQAYFTLIYIINIDVME